MPEGKIDKFITRWGISGAHERGSGQLFIIELCDLLHLPHPDPPQATTEHNDYVFERALTRTKSDGSQTPVFLDLYKAGHFVLETKQGVTAREKDEAKPSLLTGLKDLAPAPTAAKGHGTRDTKAWDKSLERAHKQARDYIHDLPSNEPVPPFLLVCDVGYVFEIFADFSGTRGTYAPFPVAGQHRIYLEDLRDEKKRDLLRTIWTDPHRLDPAKHAAKVTRQVSDALARLASSLESSQHHPEVVALFLQRCLFTLFAEDIGLLPEKSFENLLRRLQSTPEAFPTLISTLWKEMATGADFSTVISGETIVKIPHFNGGLFENPTALPLDKEQITLLLHASQQDWSEVEPAIFGTLLERALDPRDRHKLGAHYTPRSYVDRLIDPTLLQPLREQWDNAKAASAAHSAAALEAEEQMKTLTPENNSKLTKKELDVLGKKIQAAERKARSERAAAIKTIADYHHQLCETRVLDPACGSGNFLYVAMARMKELEAEVLDLLAEIAPQETLTAEMGSFKVRPDQFLGLEVNERATAIAQLVLWIGYFQWHKKATGKADTNDRPLLPKQSTIECRDAVLAYDEKVPLKDDDGNFVTIWDGHTTKPHPVTGKEIPDDTARKPVFTYENTRRTEWPEADYIVGNPPFLGASRMRDGLGDGYVEALRKVFKKHKPDSWDFVMFWWHHAAELLQAQKIKQFGFITSKPRGVKVIDAFGLTAEELAELHPGIYQHLLTSVKPERDNNKRESRKKFWWLFGEPNKKLREQLHGLPRYIATVETSKHRFFTFLDKSILPDNMLVNIAIDDAATLGILSSQIHVRWALATGGRLGMGNDPRYNKTRCFETFPFPDLPEGELKTRIRDLGERLDVHRKARQAEHLDLTLTGVYNVLEKLRKEEPLSDKDKVIHDQGLITLLKQIHDDLDSAVLEAYGWQDLTTATPLADRLAQGDEALEQEILQRLVDLNHERAAEEAQGKIRYLRPEFQDPDYGKEAAEKQQAKLGLKAEASPAAVLPVEKQPWPKTTTDRIATLKNLLTTLPAEAEVLSAALKGSNTAKRREEIQDLLEALASLGQL